MTADRFDSLFDDGDDSYFDYLDLDTIRVTGGKQHTVSADISGLALENLQREASEKGNTVSEMAAIALEQRALDRSSAQS
jgi:hypothetical protein